MDDELDFDLTIDDSEEKINSADFKEEAEKAVSTITEKVKVKPGRKAKEIKEDKILTSGYISDREITEEDVLAGNELFDTMTGFLKKEGKITPGIGIRTTIPTGIDIFDCVAGGGIVTGVSQIVGMPGSGKTALTARTLATCQRKWPGKFQSIYIDTEFSQTKERLEELGVIYPSIEPYQANTVEKVFNIIEHICAFKANNPETLDIPYCIVWDSIANTKTEKSLLDESHHSTLGLRAAMLDFLIPKYAEKLNNYNISLLCVNQLRDKIEMGHTPSINDLRFLTDKKVPGGQSLSFNTIQLFYCRQTDKIKEDVYGFPAIKVAGRFIKNKLFTPNIDIEMVFTFRRGFSNFWTNYELLKKYKIISAAAGFVTMEGYSGNKFRQKETINVYRNDAKFKEAWDNNVSELIQKEFLDKYKPGGSLKDLKEDIW
jgi:RecA/RadA recombinase